MRTRTSWPPTGTPARFAANVTGMGAEGEHAVEHGATIESTVSPAPSM